jgi:hypothetical protein
MAGSPLKRARKQGVRLEDGSLIAFPYMPRVADLPPGWRHFSAAQKIEHLIGLDRCYEILSWPPGELDPLCRSVQMQVMRVLWSICIKAMLDGTLGREAARERNRAAVLDGLRQMFTARPQTDRAPPGASAVRGKPAGASRVARKLRLLRICDLLRSRVRTQARESRAACPAPENDKRPPRGAPLVIL